MIPLRPLGLGEIIGGAFGYVRANPTATIASAAIGLTVVAAVQLVAQLLARPPSGVFDLRDLVGYLESTLAASGIAGVVGLVIGAALSGVLLTVLRGALIGRRTTFGQAWRSAAPRLPGILGIALLTSLIVTVITLVGVGLAVVVGFATRGAAAGVAVAVLLGVAGVAVAIYVAITLSLATSAYVMEDVGAVAALSRSRALVRGSWWRIFGILLLVAVIYGLVIGIVSVPINVAGSGSAFSAGRSAGAGGLRAGIPLPSVTSLVLGAIVTAVIGAFGTPLIAGVNGLLYADQRIRRERFDLELGARAAGQTGPGRPW